MKKVSVIFCALVAMLFSSCGKNDDYKSFVGSWGVEKIEYESYNVDYAGNPIPASMITASVSYNPTDIEHGIQLVFKEDKSGEMRDNDVDTVWYDWNPETHTYDSYIVNPDTTLVTKFTYSYDKEEKILYMNMAYARTFMMKIITLENDNFTYENKYDQDIDNRVYIERAFMKRISDQPTSGSKSRGSQRQRPLMQGSFLGDMR